MDFMLNEEQRMIRDMARDFAQNEIAPVAAEYDEASRFPTETIRKMGELGLMGIEVPEEYGGAGLDAVSYVLAMEEICKADAAHGTIMSVNNSLVCHALNTFGTEEQKQKYLVPVASGEWTGAYSLTEPDSGSDAAAMSSRAVRDGGEFVINGRKSWVTNGPVADVIILFTVTAPDAEPKHRGITAFIVDPDTPGFERGAIEHKLGIRASVTCECLYDDYRAPAESILGEAGHGFKIAMSVLDAGRIGIAAQALGIAQAAYEASVKYAKQREAFGQSISDFQGIQFKLADMATRIEAARLLVLRAAQAKDRTKKTGERYTKQASMAKLYASETAMWVATQAVQVHGGMGYSKELPVERYFRDAKITEIYEGTSEIQRMVIARNVLQEYA